MMASNVVLASNTALPVSVRTPGEDEESPGLTVAVLVVKPPTVPVPPRVVPELTLTLPTVPLGPSTSSVPPSIVAPSVLPLLAVRSSTPGPALTIPPVLVMTPPMLRVADVLLTATFPEVPLNVIGRFSVEAPDA